MNCQEALDLLYDIIDKEASEIDTTQVQEHLKNCHHCFEVYKVEGAVQEFINAKLAGAKQAPCLDSLKNKIVGKLDKIDEERGVARKKPPFWNASFTLAAAAFVVITIGAAFLLADFYRHNVTYVPLEKSHWTAVKEQGPFDNAAVTSAVLSYLSDTVKFSINPAVAKYNLVGGHMENIFGIQMAHLLYRTGIGSETVSVFFAPASSFKIPDGLESTKSVHGDLTFFDHHCRGCRLVYHREKDMIIVTASTDHEADLLAFVPEKPII